MGKLVDPHRLRCVHCHSTETPLWRTGPDGPKTLCNACGVRFKKGKLILYKDDAGNLTAVKRQDSIPVHVPPPAKKSAKKPMTASASNSSNDSQSSRVARNASSDASAPVSSACSKPRSRVRRSTAGQLPGRYAAKNPFDVHMLWRSPCDSPLSSPSSPADSPRISDAAPPVMNTGWVAVGSTDHLCTGGEGCTLAEEDSMFTDMACLGLDASADATNHTLLAMPADPCSAEQFTFAFSGLGRDACLAVDTPDRVEALRTLLLDGTRKPSKRYELAVTALCRLYEHKSQEEEVGEAELLGNVEKCKWFVRCFAQEYSNLSGCGEGCVGEEESEKCVLMNGSARMAVTLAEKTLKSAAVEQLRTLMDCSELMGFAEGCVIELLAEDTGKMLSSSRSPTPAWSSSSSSSSCSTRLYAEFEPSGQCRVECGKTRVESMATLV